MKLYLRFVLSWLCASSLFAAVPPDYESLKANAEKLVADGSFAQANAVYGSVNLTNLPPAEQRWVQFRLADTQWRSQAATATADTTKLDAARERLEALIRDRTRVEDHDRVWVEVQESLADFYWTRRDQPNWGAAWMRYQPALDWWAGTPDLSLARQRYLALVWKMSRPPGAQPGYIYGKWGNYVPLEVLDNVLRIAKTDNDKARAHYLIAKTLRNQGGQWEQRARVPQEFEDALKAGKATDWYDDALYSYAEWMMNQGRIIPLENGGWRSEPDYVKALELFRQLMREFVKGETRYYDQAEAQIKSITDPQVGVSVPNVFLPDSEIQYQLNWRNVKLVELALYPVELNRDVKLNSEQQQNWLQSINLTALQSIKSWTRETADKGDYRPGNDTVRLAEKLKPGAYVLEAKAGGRSGRELILVTDATLVLKTSGKQALVYFCNALDGSPIASGKVKLWEFGWANGAWRGREHSLETGTNGIAVFALEADTGGNNSVQLFASAMQGDRQAFGASSFYRNASESDAWRIYAVTDRPAYRPKETVNWKFLVRRYNGSVYSTPSDQRIEFEITDPRGAKVKADKVTLNAFGSVWGSLEVTEAMPLGEYRVQFWNEGRQRVIGNATLFRLEEYKLPEFKVTVSTPDESSVLPAVPRKKTFRLGETVEATVQADYYFGGPVANANVEILVYQNPFWQSWREPRDYAWYYEDMDASPYGRRGRGFGNGQIIKRETLKTDATGKATISFASPAGAGQDYEYRVEARVTDSSRREITGSGTLRVTRQRYYVYAQPAHNLFRPQDRVAVNFKALDANAQPMQVEGTVKVTRDYWYEIWLAPDGREVKGDELQRLQGRGSVWPPAPERPDQKGWALKFRGYQHDDILTRTLKTDTNGAVALSFTPEREGYYRVAWTSEDSAQPGVAGQPVRAETTVWVVNNASTELGYRHTGVEIIVDQDTVRVGQRTSVMLVANSPDRYVLFSVEGEDLYNYQLVHLEGTVKMVELAIEERHVPNVFLQAALVSDRQIFTDTKQVVVPPAKNFLTVDVRPDRTQYQPRDEGTLLVTTKNSEGKPVSAEVALSLVDESVFYIQGDYAGDPRKFYFGTKRAQRVQMQSTFQQKRYSKLVEGANEQLLEASDVTRQRNEVGQSVASGFSYDVETRRLSMDQYAGGRGGGGGSVGDDRLNSSRAEINAPAETALPSLYKGLGEKAADELVSVGGEPAVTVRSDFRSTVVWQPDVVTDVNGQATVKLKYPDSTTSWRATARAATSENQFGIAEETTRTRQPLIVRLQAPRFFVVGDDVVVSAVVNNNTDTELTVMPKLEAEGIPLRINGYYGALNVPPNGEARMDWPLHISQAGTLKLRVTGRGGKYSDAMEKTYTVYEHGLEKFLTKSGKARGNDLTVKLDLPKARKADSTSLIVQVTPSLAVTMLDALPYLIGYPYGCTEQTMSRFLPTVITAKTLRTAGLDPEDVMGRVFGGIETNTAAATQPGGKKNMAELDAMTKAGLERLYDFQHADGGWGWWKPGDSDHWMTAYVVWGLSLAQEAGVVLRPGVLDRATSYLDKELVEEEENPDMQAWVLHALASHYALPSRADKMTGGSDFQRKAFENLWTNREKLNAYTRALLALSAHNYGPNFGYAEKARTLIANLENGVKRDERPDTSVLISSSTLNSQPSTVQATAHWGEDGIYWRWSEGGVEATAFALRAMLAIDPTNKLVEPTANWLIKNRRGAQWSNTRDTAIVVLAMNDYLRATGELKAEADYELIVNGKSVAKKKVSGPDLFAAPSRFTIDPKLIRDANEIRIRQSGGSPQPLYFAVESKFFSTEEPVTAAGNEIFVKREYFKLVGRPTLFKGYVYDRKPLLDGEKVTSGERVETLLTIEAKNNYEYLLFEDLKPAGLEAVAVRSGEAVLARELKSGAVTAKSAIRNPQSAPGPADSALRTPDAALDYTGRTRGVYQELRDRKVALFLDKLPEGVWEIRYDLRAELPGEFHALPVVGHAMYVPEIRANGAEVRIKVEDVKP